MKKLSSIRRPFIISAIAEPTATKCLTQIEAGEQLKVDGFEINLPPLQEHDFPDIFASTNKPCIVSNRRPEFMRLFGYKHLPKSSERARIKKLLQALSDGATVVDFELDAFRKYVRADNVPFGSARESVYAQKRDSKPTQLSMTPETANQQRKLSEQIKSNGGEVLTSCHTQTRIKRNEVLRILRIMEDRGADFAKIVVHTFDDVDILDLLSTVVALNKSAHIPFNLMNFGDDSNLARLLSVIFGSSWIYCRTSSTKSFAGQPTVVDARNFINAYCHR